MSFYLTSETIKNANDNIRDLDSKVGGLLCILHCINEPIEDNKTYEINGNLLRRELSFVFDKEPKDSFDSNRSSFIIFAIGWERTFFDNIIKNQIDLLSCAIFFLRRYEFDHEATKEEIIDIFIRRYHLEEYRNIWFFNPDNCEVNYNQADVEANQLDFYAQMNYGSNFKSVLFNGVIQKSAADLKAAGQIQTLYSGSVIQTCFLLSNESLDQYYVMRNMDVPLDEEDSEEFTIVYKTNLPVEMSRNRIVFGAPGTGKSYTINKDCKVLIGENNETDYERVTFHPDYTYANFVGTYKPVPRKDDDGNETITYEYVPGPFMRVYVKALKNAMTRRPKPYLLIIEEINRANVAAVFGDIFQLLDRKDDVSEYPIQASEDIKAYLAKELNCAPEKVEKIKIPDNMFIWATMNSADQGVFPMDTAFKRRWDFTYLGIDDSDAELRGKTVILGTQAQQRVEWNSLRKAINHFLAKQKINEDKQLGPYFIARKIVVPESGNEIDRDKFIATFKNKVIMYLFEDAARQKRPSLFEGCFDKSSRYSEICKEFDEKGIGIFNNEIQMEANPEDILIEGQPVNNGEV